MPTIKRAVKEMPNVKPKLETRHTMNYDQRTQVNVGKKVDRVRTYDMME